MYKNILIPVDNSKHSDLSVEMGIRIAKEFDSRLVGSHVYAARLHDKRFRQMEGGLPARYQEPGVLEKQRNVHDSLITKGLTIISDSYLDAFEVRCQESGVLCERETMEGKNFVEIVKDVENNGYDLVIMGALGLGSVENSLIGSVCERVVRRIRRDVLLMRREAPLERILVAVDGSPQSFAGLKAALTLSKAFGADVEAVSAFDPHFHKMAFDSISGVLSEDAGKIFKFREQERLHDEIVDRGLAKIYRGHLETAKRIAEEDGVVIATALLEGKPFECILKHIRNENPSLLVVGRFGVHCAEDLDIGSTSENLLRLAPCNVLIVNGQFMVPEENFFERKEGKIPWTMEAEGRLERIPSMARKMAQQAIEDYAREMGYKEVTPEVMDEAKNKWGM